MQLNPARGRKLYVTVLNANVHHWFMQLNPARGRKHCMKATTFLAKSSWFMQLNPARGRKLSESIDWVHTAFYQVYAAQPREGTET